MRHGELGRASEPAVRSVEIGGQLAEGLVKRRRRRLGPGRRPSVGASSLERRDDPGRRLEDVLPPPLPGLADEGRELEQADAAPAPRLREVRPGEERTPVSGQPPEPVSAWQTDM
jgi:hypothetical protein